MENYQLDQFSNLKKLKRHVLFHHHSADGWIALAKKLPSGKWKQRHYKPEQLASQLSEWLGEDVYFSQNTFYKPERRIENIRQLRALYVDVDCQHLNYQPEWVVRKIEVELFREELPEPNIIIFSGRGLVCIWMLNPVPSQALPLWKALQEDFCKKLEYVGADKKSIDATRVFRLDGTINSKNGKEVAVEYRHDYRYLLRDLQQDYLPQLEPKQPKKIGRKPKIVRLHNVRSLHFNRLLDLTRLVAMRQYEVKGYRETLCFLYRYWSCCLLDDPIDALQQTMEFNTEFTQPLAKREVIRATKSAEKAWRARSDAKANKVAIEQGYPGAGYNLKNSTLIKWLDITAEEMTQLRTIIDGNEKRRRKRERDKIAFREKYGSVSREKYREQQKEITEDKLWQLEEAIRRYPRATNIKLGQLLDVSEGYIRRLKKRLKNLNDLIQD